MRRIFLSLTATFVSLILFKFISINSIHAQSEVNLEGIGISPAIQSVTPGNSYEFTIYNFTDAELKLKISPIAIEYIITDDGSREAVITETQLDLTKNIEILENEIIIAANSDKNITIKYISKINNGVIGIKIGVVSNLSNNNLDVGFESVAALVDYNMTDADILGIESSISAKLKTSIAGFSNKGEFILKTQIINQSTSFLKLSGQIEVYDGDTRLDIISISEDFPNNMYPSEKLEIESFFVDGRNIIDQFGNLKFVQTITVNGKNIISEKTVFIVPIEIFILIGVIIISFMAIILVFKKRREPKSLVSSASSKSFNI